MPPRPLLNLIIRSAIARTQRNNKVSLAHHLWMGNHPHIIVLADDINQLTRFHEELKKRLTDSIKRLLGKKYLRLWQGRTMVAEILDLDKAIERIAYMYLNPSKADLVESIIDYPGLSSWHQFLLCPPSVDANTEEVVPWIKASKTKTLRTPKPSKREERELIAAMIAEADEHHALSIKPFSWLKAFQISEPEEIENVRARIIEAVLVGEKDSRSRRRASKTRVFRLSDLEEQGLDASHTPRKNSPRIFCLSSLNELRMSFLASYRDFCARCTAAFEHAKLGLTAFWPAEAFIPCLPAQSGN